MSRDFGQKCLDLFQITSIEIKSLSAAERAGNGQTQALTDGQSCIAVQHCANSPAETARNCRTFSRLYVELFLA
jgi:hypothetical protein